LFYYYFHSGSTFVPAGIWPKKYDNEYLYTDLGDSRTFKLKLNETNECRGTNCTEQKSKFVPVPIIEDINYEGSKWGRNALRMRFGPYDNNKQSNRISLYYIKFGLGVIDRLTYFKKGENSINDDGVIEDENNKRPTAIIETLYSSDSEGVTVYFDGSKSSDKDGDNLSFQWNFGENSINDDDGNDDGPNKDGDVVFTSYTYKNPGRFTATLKVNDEMGKSSETSVMVNIDNDYDRSSDNNYGQPTLTTFEWRDQCDIDIDIDQCGILEFCFNNDTNIYGYQSVAEGVDGCQSLKMGVAPVIRLVPGKTYRLKLRNLSNEPTNIHTHGLHIVGSGNGDDITRIVQGGGSSIDYVWDIRNDHPGGTYW
jgi:hypothetical protein